MADERPLADKVAFLSCPAAYGGAVTVQRRETHMSWVFLTDETVYKLKKPVRFPYLDFSSLARREAACRAELALNRRLAPDVYLDVVPLMQTSSGLALSGSGEVVDWLVKMRRLDEDETLEHAIAAHTLAPWQIDRLARTLIDFYRHAKPVFVAPALHLSDWRRALEDNRKVLLDPRFGLHPGLVSFADAVLRRFLAVHRKLLVARCRARLILDAHGDLRPEHIWLGDPVRVIDCLEFNPRLRAIDPFDEIAFLGLECERLGAPWIDEYLWRRVGGALHGAPPRELYLFYRCYRAMLRARLAIAHLAEPNPRTPEKWPRQARTYLRLAMADAVRLEPFVSPRPRRVA